MILNLKTEHIYLILGFLGQFLFFMRFFIQWLVSEKQKKSVIPISFWFFSISGGVLLLTYAIIRKDPVFILGQSCGLLIYSRNLFLIYKKKS
tara:strand:+ start:1000 stop:1275 length:276 start_codon:yes stop_codon:yes gene_type:complete